MMKAYIPHHLLTKFAAAALALLAIVFARTASAEIAFSVEEEESAGPQPRGVVAPSSANDEEPADSVVISLRECRNQANAFVRLRNPDTGKSVKLTDLSEKHDKVRLTSLLIGELRNSSLGGGSSPVDCQLVEKEEDGGERVLERLSFNSKEVPLPRFRYGDREHSEVAEADERTLRAVRLEYPRLIFAADADDDQKREGVKAAEENMATYCYEYELPNGDFVQYLEPHASTGSSSAKSTSSSTAGNFEITNLDGPMYYMGTDYTCTVSPMSSSMLAAMSFACKRWSEAIRLDVPVKIVTGLNSDLPSYVIGSTYTSPAYYDSAQACQYPYSLINQIKGYDMDESSSDIYIVFNPAFPFYLGTDGKCPANKQDFLSTALHELNHGLGFASNHRRIQQSDDTVVVDGSYYDNQPAVFDMFLYSDGRRLSGATQAQRKKAYTSNALYWDGDNAKQAYNGKRPKMYAPPEYDSGSSVSHWDDSNTFDTFMTYSARYGDVNHEIDAVTKGALKDIGYTLATDSQSISASPSAMSFGTSSGFGSFSVTAASSWTVSKSASWITLNTTKGNGNGTVSYSVVANTTAGERTGTITVTGSGGDTATHTVKQSGAEKLSVSPASADFDNTANGGSFAVSANCAWSATASEAWLKSNVANGSGNGTVTYSVAANSGAKRTGTITVTSANGSLSATHKVTQAAQPSLTISPASDSIAATAAGGSFSVSSDSMWTATKSDAWITLKTTGGSGNGTVSYSTSKNTGAGRTGYIYVKSGSVQRTFTLAQRCADIVSFSDSSVLIPSDGGEGTVTATVLADGSSTVTAPSSYTGGWISWTRSDEKITDGHRYTYSWAAQANTTGSEREEAIDIVLNGTTYRCTFVQDAEAGSYRVTYRPGAYGTGDEITIVKQGGGIFMLKNAIYTREGYTQTGWATSDGGPKAYGLLQYYMGGKSIVLYPYWEKKETTYTVAFEPGAYGEGASQTFQKTAGVDLTLPGALFTRTGYEQTGWSTSKTGMSKAYGLGDRYTADASATFYPYWTETADEGFDIAFYCDEGWDQPVFLNSEAKEWGLYAPQYVFNPGDSLWLYYCLSNRNKSISVPAAAITRHVTLYRGEDGAVLKYLDENYEKGYFIQPGGFMRFRGNNVGDWLSSCSPGNYAIQVRLSLAGPHNASSANGWTTWFAVKAPDVTLNEALDCDALQFMPDAESTPVFPQVDQIATGGTSVQFGPQATTASDTILWANVTGPGTLSFKWDVQSSGTTNACMAFFVDGEMKTWVWSNGDDWADETVEVGEGSHWVSWLFQTIDANPSCLSAGWLDGVVWTPSEKEHAVVYKPGSAGSGFQWTETKQQGVPLALRGAVFTRTGYTQTGWALDDGGDKAYDLLASYTADADVTLYPFWTANTYSVAYDLDGGTAGTLHPAVASYGTSFPVSAPSREAHAFQGWLVTSGLDAATARCGSSSEDLSCAIENEGQLCFNGSGEDVWFANLTAVPDGAVVLTATWEPVDDGKRDIGYYAPESEGWPLPAFLSSTNVDFLVYAPESEFIQGSKIFLSFCAVNWNRSGTALLQSTLLTFTDENGGVVEQGEPIQHYTFEALAFQEFRNIPLNRYLDGIAPGRYKLTAELDPNKYLDDPDRSNNSTSIWFTIVAPTEPIPDLPSDASPRAIATALDGSADGGLAKHITDASTYAAYREWAGTVQKADGVHLADPQTVKDSKNAWLSFALGSETLLEEDLSPDAISIVSFSPPTTNRECAFEAEIAGVKIGGGQVADEILKANLEKVLGIEGAAELAPAFQPEDIGIGIETPANGRARIIAVPPANKDAPYFMRVKVNSN